MEQMIEKITEYLTTNGLEFLRNSVIALLIFIIGKWAARLVADLAGKAMDKAKADKTLSTFIVHFAYVTMLVFVIIMALGSLGVPVVQFVAVLGAAGLAVGLALQGSLSNFAAGVLLVIFKPFKVGDFVEVNATKGAVQEIQIFNTVLNSPDNVRVIIPNAQVTGGNILNYTSNGKRRVDLKIGISYGDDIQKAKQVIENVLNGHEKILSEPSAKVAVFELGDSSVNFVVRPWVQACDYWDVYFDVTAKVKLALEQNGITIPFPQRDVHIKQDLLSQQLKASQI